MALLTNKMDFNVDLDRFDAAFDLFEVQKDTGYKLSWESRVFEPFGAPYILSIVGQGGESPFYLLAPHGAVSESVLRGHFEESYRGVMCDETLDEDDVGSHLLPKKKSGRDVPCHVLLQLLLNALYAQDHDGAVSLQNVTGHLYCFKPGSPWIRKTKDKRVYQIVGLEIKVTKDMLLTAHVVTFTRANASGLKFTQKRKRSEYPRYVVDLAGPTMRRVSPGERPEANSLYIQKQYEGTKSRISFLKYQSNKVFENSKCGVIAEIVDLFNDRYSAFASLSFGSVDDGLRLPVPGRLLDPDFRTWYRRKEFVVVDVARDAASAMAVEVIADSLARDSFLGKRPRVVRGAVAGANNLLVIHDKAFYEGSGQPDPYAVCAIQGASCQHVTVERVLSGVGTDKSKSVLDLILTKCLVEAAVKDDVHSQSMGLFDWSSLRLDSPMTFALSGPESNEAKEAREGKEPPGRYSFLTVEPDGRFRFSFGEVSTEMPQNVWDELAEELQSEWSSACDGFIVSPQGSIEVIESTDGFPVPDLALLGEAINRIDWSIPKEQVLSALSFKTGDPSFDEVLSMLYESVACLEAARVSSSKLSGLVKEAVASVETPYGAKYVRKLIGRKLELLYDLQLQTSISRDRKARETMFEPLLGMHCIKGVDGSLYYWASGFGALDQSGFENGAVIRRVRSESAGQLEFESLFQTMTVPIARLGNPSVLPLPFKYLREWMQMQTIS